MVHEDELDAAMVRGHGGGREVDAAEGAREPGEGAGHGGGDAGGGGVGGEQVGVDEDERRWCARRPWRGGGHGGGPTRQPMLARSVVVSRFHCFWQRS